MEIGHLIRVTIKNMKIIIAIFLTLFITLQASPASNLQPITDSEETRWEARPPNRVQIPTRFLEAPIHSYYKPPELPLEKIEKKQFKLIPAPNALKQVPHVYRLQIGDQLEISLYGNIDIETKRRVRLEPSGYISYLFIEPVFALGKTIDELRKDLFEKIQKIYPHVLVSINAINLIGDQFTIMGEVKRPGTKQIYGEMTLLDAIGGAGGFPMRPYRGQLIDYADLDRAFVSRHGNYIPINFDALIRQGDLSQNIRLRSGDYVYIPSLINKQVFILGEVLSPLAYSYLQTASLLEALAWAGGPTIRAGCKLVVIRGSLSCPTYFVFDWYRMRCGCCPDFLLQPGDIVYVPIDSFWEAGEMVKGGIRTFVGALISIAGQEAFIDLYPEAANSTNGSVFINPGASISLPPVLVPAN